MELWQHGVDAVAGDASVARALRDNDMPAPTQIIAVGKAASAMARAASVKYPKAPILIVTKDGHSTGAPRGAVVIEAAHPVPNTASLKGGGAIAKAVVQTGPDAHILMLVSGGASALAEVLQPGLSLADLMAATTDKLASGADIHAINAMRRDLSQIKGGKLFANFQGRRVTTLAISDVEGDDLNVIGSGIGMVHAPQGFAFEAQIVAANRIARAAIAQRAQAEDIAVHLNAEDLYADVATLAPALPAQWQKPGLYVHGGEPTVTLPNAPGRGGRNMMLALRIAREIAGDSTLHVLVAGTDGSDGPTDAAGAYLTGATWDASGAEAIATAAPYDWLEARCALLKPGPTGTNVMDLALAWRAP